MPFGTSWHTLLDECDALDDEATLVTPLTETEFRITDVQDHRIVITEIKTGDTELLQRDQFATLWDRDVASDGGMVANSNSNSSSEPVCIRHIEPSEQGGKAYVRCRDCERELLVKLGGRDHLLHAPGRSQHRGESR